MATRLVNKIDSYATVMTDEHGPAATCLGMVNSKVPDVIAAERLNEGVVIKFANGHCGFYSSAFLFSKLGESEQLDEAEVEW